MPTKSNKYLLLFLVVFTVIVFVGGYFHLKGTIYGPFVPGSTLSKEQALTQAGILAIQDTDKDGLTDFDERFVYSTSAYISDSDSDGFSDKQEIDAQSNPVDPKSTPLQAVPTSQDVRVSQETLPVTGQAPSTKSTEEESFLEKVFPAPNLQAQPLSEELGDLSVQEIRDLLINQAGLDKEVVDKIDDKTLIMLYNETKQETGIDLNKLTGPQQPEGQFLDISQIRQLLIEQGIDSELLESIDDETLRSMFLQSLSSQ